MKTQLMATLGVVLAISFGQCGWSQVPADRVRRIEQACPEKPIAIPRQVRRVLIFNTPPHLMPDDPHKGYCIPYGALALQKLGQKTNAFEPTVSDDLMMFLPENIGQFDAIVLNNTSRNWITPTAVQVQQPGMRKHGRDVEQIEGVLRQSLLDFVRGGGGLMAIHYAIGANKQWPEFAALLGASYDGHPWNEEVAIKLDEPDHPIVKAFAEGPFRLAEEIFQFKAPYSRDHVRVLLSLDVEHSNMTVPWIRRQDNDFALAWVRPEGQGRVFYSAIGHRTEHYWNPQILRFYLAGLQFCTGDLTAPDKPLKTSERDGNIPGL